MNGEKKVKRLACSFNDDSKDNMKKSFNFYCRPRCNDNMFDTISIDPVFLLVDESIPRRFAKSCGIYCCNLWKHPLKWTLWNGNFAICDSAEKFIITRMSSVVVIIINILVCTYVATK